MNDELNISTKTNEIISSFEMPHTTIRQTYSKLKYLNKK